MKVKLSKPFFDWESNLRPATGPDGEKVIYDWPDDIPVPDMTHVQQPDGSWQIVDRSGSGRGREHPKQPVMKEAETFSEITATLVAGDPTIDQPKAKK